MTAGEASGRLPREARSGLGVKDVRVSGLSRFLGWAIVVAVLPQLASCECNWPGVGRGSPTPSGTFVGGGGDGSAYTTIEFWNCNPNQQNLTSGPHRSVSIYMADTHSPPWVMPAGPGPMNLDAQYNSSGICPYNEDGTYAKPLSLDLAPPSASGQHIIEVGIVDPGLTGCGANDPTIPACLLQHFLVWGDKNGNLGTLKHIIG